MIRGSCLLFWSHPVYGVICAVVKSNLRGENVDFVVQQKKDSPNVTPRARPKGKGSTLILCSSKIMPCNMTAGLWCWTNNVKVSVEPHWILKECQHFTRTVYQAQQWKIKSTIARCVTMNQSISQSLFYRAPKSWSVGQLSLPHVIGITKTEINRTKT